MPTDTEKRTCVRCGLEVRVNRDSYELFEGMHYARFHFEFEQMGFDPDEAYDAPGCPSSPLSRMLRAFAAAGVGWPAPLLPRARRPRQQPAQLTQQYVFLSLYRVVSVEITDYPCSATSKARSFTQSTIRGAGG